MRVCVPMFVVMAAACSGNSSSPTQPSASTTTTSAMASSPGVSSAQSLTASVAAPRPLQPANSAMIANLAQPVTLVVQNAVTTQPGGATYLFEVATDPSFGTKVQSKDGIAEGSNGQTAVKLDTLAAAKDYYWHARAEGGGTTGVFGATFKFTVGPAITISAPAPIAPLNGGNDQCAADAAHDECGADRSGRSSQLSVRDRRQRGVQLHRRQRDPAGGRQ
jgi:hypothetical protein